MRATNPFVWIPRTRIWRCTNKENFFAQTRGPQSEDRVSGPREGGSEGIPGVGVLLLGFGMFFDQSRAEWDRLAREIPRPDHCLNRPWMS